MSNFHLCECVHDITSLPHREPAESWVPLGLFSVILTIWSFCQHTHIHTLLCKCNPPYMKCLSFVEARPCWAHINRAQRGWAAGQRLRAAILLYSGANVWKAPSKVFRPSTAVLNPDSCVFVPLGKGRNSFRTSGGSQTSHPSWSGCSQTPDGASAKTPSERSHEDGRKAWSRVWSPSTHVRRFQQLSLLLFWRVGLWKGF